MRLLASENFPADAVLALRHAEHDVFWVRSDAPGAVDTEVLQRAQAEGRVLLTFDKDFGELAFRAGLPATSGVILLRVPAPSAGAVAHLAVSVIGSRIDWPGHFSVVTESRIRMTPLPQ
jgi:predicted nuclease of predicted toxin-antitoxin system